MKKTLFALALAALLSLAPGSKAQNIQAAIVFQNYDLDSVGAYVYCDTANPISPSLGSQCATGTDPNDGWMNVPPGTKEVNLNVDACVLLAGTDSCRLTVEGRYEIQGSTRTNPLYVTNDIIAPIDVLSGATPGGIIVRLVEGVDQIRLGLQIAGTGDDGGDVTPEDITVVIDFFS